MKGLCISFLMLVFLATLTQAQHSYDARKGIDVGSCKRLSGKVAVLIIPVSSPGAAWNGETIAKIFSHTATACRWLEGEAKQVGVDLDLFAISQWGVSLQLQVKDTSLSPEQIVNMTIGYDSLKSYLEHAILPMGFDQVALVYAFHGTEGTYASKVVTDRELRHFEGVKWMYDAGRSSEVHVMCIAHELLHLFGAMDFYQLTNLTPQLQHLVAHSVMWTTDPSIETLEVDPITQYLIGWREQPEKAWRKVFKQPNWMLGSY